MIKEKKKNVSNRSGRRASPLLPRGPLTWVRTLPRSTYHGVYYCKFPDRLNKLSVFIGTLKSIPEKKQTIFPKDQGNWIVIVSYKYSTIPTNTVYCVIFINIICLCLSIDYSQSKIIMFLA